jgi:hypothetical protein
VLHAVSALWPTTRTVGPDGTVTTITTLGPAVGYRVVGALEDLRTDVFTVRNLFPAERHPAGPA